jgi:exoribonuclease II
MSLEGQIIEFLDSDDIKVGYVRKQERDRLHVIDPRGRNLNVNGDRVVVVHRRASESEFPMLAREIADKVEARRIEVDVELLWESVSGSLQEFQPTDLARTFFSEQGPEAVAAVFHALFRDSLFFKRKGCSFLPRNQEQVSAERTRRHRQLEREQFREQTSSLLHRLIQNRKVEITAEMTPLMDRLYAWLRHRTGDEIGAILEQITGVTRARDVAYDLLVRAGRIDTERDRFLVLAGVDEVFGEPLLQAALQLHPYSPAIDRPDYGRAPDLATITIDDEDTREVDDALTIQHSAGEIIVGIHIADVSSFVGKGDLLDAEASRRSSTIYLPNMTVPMFPERLSCDLASLVENAPRPAFTVEVRFDAEHNQLGYRITLSTIQVSKRLSYDQADALLDAGDPHLKTIHSIATHLQQLRASRGAITFRRPELKIRVDQGQVHIRKIDPKSASRVLVSEMMILANGLAADFASVNSLPVIFRTQESREALAVEDTPLIEALAFDRLRKTFKRSRLSLTPGVHSGLGLTAYTQASSPIRRYADLVTQRQFTALLRGIPLPYAREELLQILAAAETTEVEIRSIEDRSTNYWLLEHLSREKTGQAMNAIVLDQKGNIELEDYYLRGKVSGAPSVTAGQPIRVMIESVDSLKGDIRFKYA